MAEVKVQQIAQQALAGIPGLLGSVIIGGYDPADGSLRVVNLSALVEPLVLAEKAHSLDKLDARNAQKTVTIPSGSALATQLEATLEVPAGEVWFINRVTLATPLEVEGNFRISRFGVEADGKDKRYLAANQAVNTTTDHDLGAVGELGAELRLAGGDKVTVVGRAAAAATADRVVTLTAFGRKGKRLV